MTAQTASIHDLQAAKNAGLPASAPLATGPRDVAVVPGFNSAPGWELAQRIAKAWMAADLVPQHYRGNLPNTIVALEMANRMGASPLMVMQNLYIVHGNPGWSSKFLIACFNQCGRFSALRYKFRRDDKGKALACRAWAVERATGETLEGAEITLEMAKEEGWSTKPGSKWKTMPEQMLMYRSASFFVRTYAPEISMGLQTAEEIVDGIYDAPADSVRTIEDLQQERILAPAGQVISEADNPAAGGEPQVTYAQIAAAIRDAKDRNALDEAAVLIGALVDVSQRRDLEKLYDERLQDLEG